MFDILLNIITPIFVIIGLGALLSRIFDINVRTLSRLMFYVYSPAVLFVVVLNSDIQANDVLLIGTWGTIQLLILMALGWAVGSLKPFKEKRSVLTLTTAFSNSANYGFPLMLLAFDEYAISIMAVIILVQALGSFTVGIMLFDRHSQTFVAGVKRLLGFPVLYGMALGFLFRWQGWVLPKPLMLPTQRLADGYVALALLTLGAQLARTRFYENIRSASVGVFLKLIISPLISFALIPLFRFEPAIESVLLLASALPSAVNVYILAVEFDHDADFASLVIFWTTLLTAITIPVVLLLIKS